jgi:putative peptidoglycan lipid II flippase
MEKMRTRMSAADKNVRPTKKTAADKNVCPTKKTAADKNVCPTKKTAADKNVCPTKKTAADKNVCFTTRKWMSTEAVPLSSTATEGRPARAKSFVHHAKLISLLTLVSRILGVLRESLAARYFGAGLVSTAFTVAFTIPNLFRRLFGEGALSAAFIPLYSQALRSEDKEAARRFAAASVNLLGVILLALTILGELILAALVFFVKLQSHHLLTVKLTAIMLPYVLLICGAAFLGAILQVHKRFGLVAAAPILLNVAMIGSTVLGARFWNMSTQIGQIRAIFFVSLGVLVAGALQVAMLIPDLRAIGFRFELTRFWTPAVKRMLMMSIPVAIGAGVLQLSVVLDRGMSYFLAQGIDPHDNLITHFTLLGQSIRYPMQFGAAPRLFWAQLLYQFPLGVFAIALATAIFPTLSDDALDANREKFRSALRRGIKVTLWEGLPCSLGLVIVAEPAVQLLFERGRFTFHDTALVVQSLRFYALAIWAFSLQQIISRAYYALHDMLTPLLISVAVLVLEMAVKLPLIWSGLGESGMAAGTAIVYTLQTLVMLGMLQRKCGGLGLGQLTGYITKLILATALMGLVCWSIQKAPFFPHGTTRLATLLRLLTLVMAGAFTYIVTSAALGVGMLEHVLPRKSPRPAATT